MMKNSLIQFNIKKGDVNQMAALAADSARVLGKYGSNRFLDFANEADYFCSGIDYHAFRIEATFNEIKIRDKEIHKSAGDYEYVMEGRRSDVLMTVYEFDSLLVYTRSLFDRILQILMTPLNCQLPKSITQFEKKFIHHRDQPIVSEFLMAWRNWGKRAKDYRDCLLHYWTFYKGTYGVFKTDTERQLLIPDNPEVNSPQKFTYDRKISMIDYAKDIKIYSQSILHSIIQQVFETFLKEEFGANLSIRYWDSIPHVELDQISGNHKIKLSPGLAWDEGGRIIRFDRILTVTDGEVKYYERVPYDWLKDAIGSIVISSDQTYLVNTEFPIALKLLYDLEHGLKKRRRRQKKQGDK